MEKLRIVVGGFIGLYPTGGVTWDYIQYPLGLKMLGHDVYYLEDTCQFPKYQKEGKNWDDASDSVEYLENTMKFFGLEGRWAYRDVASGKCFGISENKLLEVCATADVFINISASTILRDEYLKIPKRVFIDSDPMFTQIQYSYGKKEPGVNQFKMDCMLESHNYHFSFGENIGNEDCLIPLLGINWKTTRQPICLNYWNRNEIDKRGRALTTIMNWSVVAPLVYNNTTWGQKKIEFEKIMGIPKQFLNNDFELIAAGIPEDEKPRLASAGWKLNDPLDSITDAISYRNFIFSSLAEFSVAKETYVKSNSGWFSCRSACYLAAGRPVITQETGWSKFIPTGNGLFSFSDMKSASEAINDLLGNYLKHCISAKEIAGDYFDSYKVLANLLERLN